jgi:hypothetical protein
MARARSLLASVLVLVATGCADDEGAVATSQSAPGSAGAGGQSGGGGGASAGSGGAGPTFCAGPSTIPYDPLSGVINIWPDDFWTVDDTTTLTGKRVHVVVGDNFMLPPEGKQFGGVFDELSMLDGFGTTSGMEVQFSTEIDPATLPPGGDGSDVPGSSVLLVDLDAPTPALVAIETALFPEVKEEDPASTLIVTASLPLRPKAHYGLVVTRRVHDMKGSCVTPSPTMASLLDGTASDPKLAPLVPRYADLVKKLVTLGAITSASDITAATVFTTQHTVEDSAAIATDIRSTPVTYQSSGPCTVDPGGLYRVCEGMMSAHDYRTMHHHVDEGDLTKHDAWMVPVTTYLPISPPPGPLPTMLFGHGLGGDRHQASELADFAAPRNIAVIAIDSVKHGDHPDQPPATDKITAITSFFGFDIAAGSLDTRSLRDNFRESTYDKLQAVEMLRPGLDVDGDGNKDVDLSHFMFLGVSLGGIMSSEFLAFSPETQLAVTIVPGARVTDIIQFSKTFAPIILIAKGSASDGQVARTFPFIQTAIDRGDSGAYTQHIVTRRLPGFDSAVPQVLMQMVIDDDTVPNVCNRFFARGLGVPLLGDELQHIGSIPLQPMLPVTANLDPAHTSGVFQYDLVWSKGSGACPPCDLSTGKTQTATHGNVGANPITIDQTFAYLDSYLKTGVATVVDPYRELGIKK